LAIQAAERDELEDFWERSAELDFWMRSDGRRRNPGTSADLIAAGLAVGLYNQQLELNFQWKTNER
jgi:triphosphoribosyl-dephospho-CoA synthase